MKKYLSGLLLFTGSLFAESNLTLSRHVLDNTQIPFVSHSGPGAFDSYLTMNITFEPIKDLLDQFSATYERPLISRGEAHITVVTPPEFLILKKMGISISDIDGIARQRNIQSSRFEPICIGKGSAQIKRTVEETFYVVVKAEDLLAIRRDIFDLFQANGGTKDQFNPDSYFPHITLGFTARDLHESDGVIKDVKSCVKGLDISQG